MESILHFVHPRRIHKQRVRLQSSLLGRLPLTTMLFSLECHLTVIRVQKCPLPDRGQGPAPDQGAILPDQRPDPDRGTVPEAGAPAEVDPVRGTASEGGSPATPDAGAGNDDDANETQDGTTGTEGRSRWRTSDRRPITSYLLLI